ncbi:MULTISPECIES: hypothetical protein [unclassified Pseudomonas]|uniref:hypothetical protein n=1 Tax=unclassified Pseudomonas TaxID=196821 RepID=UPI001648DA30|nr:MULTISPECIES: hypothetical protein [unclassified Pseudomonas]MBC3269895.1 hypothetical protein [Pseudomonas sp. SWRI81]MBC3776502.1 hypothetical protein [Pseudomonas sp. SWRI99]
MSRDADHPDLHSRQIPIREDMAYQRKVWRFERCGWYALVLCMVLGLLGLFSRGPISSQDVRSADGAVRVEYDRFHRNGSTNPMKVSVRGAPQATVEVELNGELLEGFSVETMQPPPLRARSAAQGLHLWLQADTQGQATLYLTLRGDGLGLYRSTVKAAGAESVTLTQFIFP